jgi:hypothetical protein
MQEQSVDVFLSRDESTMVSSWREYLGLSRVTASTWRIGTFLPEWLGTIHDLVPEEERYTEDGDLIVPETWNGKKITRLADGEYLETDQLVASDDLQFQSTELDKAHEFCVSHGWSEHADFEEAWKRIEATVQVLKKP